MMLQFVVFGIILGVTIFDQHSARLLLARTRDEWVLDLVGLVVQGIVVPILLVTLLIAVLSYLLPNASGVIYLAPLPSFLLSFVVVDYLYYWNHRLLHRWRGWSLHWIHHSTSHLDVLATARNSLLSPFVLVYLWINGFCIFLLGDPNWYLLGFAMTGALDLWRHSGLAWEPPKVAHLLVTPRLHALHHSIEGTDTNFGANLILWDKIHGTYLEARTNPSKIGIPCQLSLWQKLLLPSQNMRSESLCAKESKPKIVERNNDLVR